MSLKCLEINYSDRAANQNASRNNNSAKSIHTVTWSLNILQHFNQCNKALIYDIMDL